MENLKLGMKIVCLFDKSNIREIIGIGTYKYFFRDVNSGEEHASLNKVLEFFEIYKPKPKPKPKSKTTKNKG